MTALHPLDTWHRFVAMQMDPEQTALNLERNVGLDARKLIAGAKKYRVASQAREVK